MIKSTQINQKKCYNKVSERSKWRLFKLVILKGKKIKKAASILNIKYSTAKTIIYYRKKQFRRLPQTCEATKVCGYTYRPNLGTVNVITKIGGHTISKCEQQHW